MPDIETLLNDIYSGNPPDDVVEQCVVIIREQQEKIRDLKVEVSILETAFNKLEKMFHATSALS